MKARFLLPSLLLAAICCSFATREADAFHLFDRMFNSGGGCDSCCEPVCCEPEPVCCEPVYEPACCEPVCDPCCRPRRRPLRDLLDRLSRCCHSACCEPEPSCCGY